VIRLPDESSPDTFGTYEGSQGSAVDPFVHSGQATNWQADANRDTLPPLPPGYVTVELLDRVRVALADRYEVEREVGRGGMAFVYAARDLKHERPVAIKVMRPEIAAALGPERFLREIKIEQRLQHSHILPLLDSDVVDELPYYVMPFVTGESLRQRLERESQLPVEEVLHIAGQVAEALDYAHGEGVIHRDIKPENILLAGETAYVADFGIARAAGAAGGEWTSTSGTSVWWTSSGMVVGTPGYMSPEQATAATQVDGRSDQYSLACVVYEMLAGERPYSGSSVQAIVAKMLSLPPPSVRVVRERVPQVLDEGLRRGLARTPADRFRTCREFVEELRREPASIHARLATDLAPASGESRDSATVRRRTTLRRIVVGAGSAGAAVALFSMLLGHGPRAVAAGVAVLPLLHNDSLAERALNGDQCARLLYDALSRWNGIALINDMVVRDARARYGGQIRSLSAAAAIGHDLGARYVVWGEVMPAAGGINVNATLFDISRGMTEVRHRAVFIEAGGSVEVAFAALADSLLLGILPRDVPPAAIAGTRNFAALRAYASAHSALDAWDLAAAESLFRAATALDQDYAAAQLELAQVIVWRAGSPDEWRPAALHASTLRFQLGDRQRRLADALLAIADSEPRRACETYQALVRRDSLDFDAWFGLGECQSRDRLVIRDSTSRSGWRFRSSQHAAINAYRRALELAPLFQRALTSTAYDRVAHLLYSDVGQIRTGSAAAPYTGLFAAYPELAADSLAFVPYPIESLYAAAPGTYPQTHMQAVDRNRRLLRGLARRWVASAPRDARAHEIFSASLENLVELGPTVPAEAGGEDALSEIKAARRLATDSATRIRAAALQIRLLVKTDQDAAAANLADSLLATQSVPHGTARYLAGVAALVGRANTAARWARQAAEDLVDLQPFADPPLPLEPTRDASALLVFAASGTEPDSVRQLLARVEVRLAAVSSAAQRFTIRQNLLDWSTTLAYPKLGLSSLHRRSAGGNSHMEIEWEIAHGDTAAARRTLRALRAFGERERPGDAGFDAVALEAELRLTLGDSATASTLLEQTLDATESSGRQLVEGLAESAGFGRALSLGAQLAERRGARSAARRWAQTYVDLMSGAEGHTRDVLRSMRGIAARR
jgi:TolB-like protein